MIQNINIATNAELEKEMEALTEKFETTKAEIYNKYVLLQNFSEQYEQIKAEIDKRKGKGNG